MTYSLCTLENEAADQEVIILNYKPYQTILRFDIFAASQW